jgi:flavin-dependent dehydrogenase
MYDFVIVGAGPTGSYCAARLAKQGYQVKLIDKAHHPRDKLCGGGLTLKSLSRIKSLHTGLEQSGLLDYIKYFEVMNPTTFEKIDVKWYAKWLALVKRDEFDKWMLDKAIECGASYQEEKFTTLYNGESDFIIAADGANSEVGKMIHGPFTNDEVIVATEAYVPNFKEEQFASIVMNPTHDPDNGGYSWLFGRHDRVGVGTGCFRTYDKFLNDYRSLISTVSAVKYHYHVEPKDYHNWIIPIYKGNKFASLDNMACIGDALGTADPLFAEGIAAGLISADVLINSFNKYRNFSHLTEDINNDEYFQEMQWMHFLQQQANSNYNAAFNLLSQKNVAEGFIKFINWHSKPSEFVKWIKLHYPIHALRLAYNVWRNKGNEL